jgi:small subunit ribosomal protein S17
MGIKKRFEAVVVSNKMDKTVVVIGERIVKDCYTEKYVKKKAKFIAHDEKNECKLGDRVQIVQTRPLSRRKHFRVFKIIEQAK